MWEHKSTHSLTKASYFYKSTNLCPYKQNQTACTFLRVCIEKTL